MKKINKLAISLLAVTTCMAMLPLANVSASAGAQQTVFLDEQFMSSAFSGNKWQLDTASESMDLAFDVETGHINIAKPLDEYHLGTATKIEGLKYLQFDYAITYKNPNGWFAFNFFGERSEFDRTLSAADREERYNRELAFASNGFQSGHFASGLHGNYASEAKLSDVVSGNVEDGEWYTFRMEYVSSTEVMVYGAPRGEDVKESFDAYSAKLTLTDAATAKYNFDAFYVLIGLSGDLTLQLDNIKIESDSVNFEERFLDAEFDPEITQYSDVGASFAYIEPNNYFAINEAEAGDQILYNAPIPKEESIVEDIEIIKANFNVSFGKAQGDAVAFAFGIPSSKKIADGCYMLVVDDEGVALNKYVNGQMTPIIEKFEVAELADGNYVTVKIVAKKTGETVLQCIDLEGAVLAETSGKIEGEDFYVGYLGFVAPQKNYGKIMIDALTINTVSYKIPTTKSVSHNFSNDFFGNEGYEDFVMNANGGSMSVKDGKLVWEGCSDWSFFGSAYEYDNFVMDFKICSVLTTDKDGDSSGTGIHRWLGMDFAKKNKAELEYGTNVMFAFHVVPAETDQLVNVWIWDQTGTKSAELSRKITINKGMPADWFRAIGYNGADKTEADVREGDAVCIRWVSENGILRMYAKRACEMEYQLFYEIQDMNMMGYIALCNTGFAWWKLDDFSISNISDLYYNADSFAPEKQVITEEKTWYDRGNVDENGLNETELNKGQVAQTSGCAGEIGVACALLPMLFAGGVILGKKSKNRGK